MKKIIFTVLLIGTSSLNAIDTETDFQSDIQFSKENISNNFSDDKDSKPKVKSTPASVATVLSTGIVIGSLTGIGNAMYEQQFHNGEQTLSSWFLFFIGRTTADTIAEKIFDELEIASNPEILYPTSWLASWGSYLLAKRYM